MPRFIVERKIPETHELTRQELIDLSVNSFKAVAAGGADIEWIQSFVTSDKMYCMYRAPDQHTVQRYAEQSGFPEASIDAIKQMVDSFSAEVD